MVLLSSISIVRAQKSVLPEFHYDTAYFTNFDNNLAVRLVSPHRLFSFNIKNTDNGEKYSYRPNLHFGMGVGFTYKWLAIDITFSPDFTSRNNEKYGKTKEFNLEASFYLRNNIISFMFRRYQGMYESNPEDYIDGWEKGMNHPQRPDLNSIAVDINYSIPLNPTKYSMRSTFLLDGRLKKSSGSFIGIPSMYYYHAQADSSMLPIGFEDKFPDEANITAMNFLLLGGAFGYAYTFVIRDFYFTLSALPAFSINMGKVKSDAGDYGVKPLSFKFSSKNGFGYNSRRWYTGIYFVYDFNNVRLENNLNFANNLGGWRIFVGYRIKAPKVLKKYVD